MAYRHRLQLLAEMRVGTVLRAQAQAEDQKVAKAKEALDGSR